MKTGFLVLLLLCFWPGSYSPKQDTPNAIPVIRLDKARFARGEEIFFWEGVRQTSRAAIPKKFQNTCRRTVTRPDGTQITESVGWPIDGPPDSGWLGGAGLPKEPQQLGRYTVVFEFAGQKTAPGFLFVEDAPILKNLKTAFVFANGKNDQGILAVNLPTNKNLTLIVDNRSDQTVRFARPAGSGQLISVSIRRLDGTYTNDFFYPEEKLPRQDQTRIGSTGFDVFTWDLVGHVPTVTLKPGESFRQKFSLQAVFDEARKTLPLAPGEYNVTFSAQLQILIGERDGPWAALSPVRLSVTGSATCLVSG